MLTYADRPWIKNYDPGVPETLHPYPEVTLPDFLRQSAKKYPEQPALITPVKLPLLGYREHRLTYAELDRLTDVMAAALIGLGMKKGDKVALVMPNITAFVIAYYGALKAGGVVAAANPTYPAEKMLHQIDDCDAEIVIAMTMFYDMLKAIQPQTKVKHIIATNIKEYMDPIARTLFTVAMEKKGGHRIDALQEGDYWLQDLLKQYEGQKPDVNVTPDDLALLQYTGGTTGTSKGAMATHRALVASTLQIEQWTSVKLPGITKSRHEHTVFAALPMFHVYGLIAILSQGLSSGMPLTMIANPRDISGLVDMINHYRPDIFLGVPALYSMILDHPRVKSGEVSLDSIIISQSGASPMHPDIKAAFEAAGGRCLFEGYGLSEIPVGNHSNPMLNPNKSHSVGMPLTDVECIIVNLENDEEEVPVGEIGEIVIHAPHMFSGYYKLPTETAETLRTRTDGRKWVFTGDIGYMDEDGYFFIVDRRKDMATIGGFNVFPANVERVLMEHPAVENVAVAAIPHPTKIGEEALKAWIILKEDIAATREEIIAHCEPKLAGYEIPRRYDFVKELPHSAVGKMLRRELVRMEIEGMQA